MFPGPRILAALRAATRSRSSSTCSTPMSSAGSRRASRGQRKEPPAAGAATRDSSASLVASASTPALRARSRPSSRSLAERHGGAPRRARSGATPSTWCSPSWRAQFGKPVASLETPEMQMQALQMPIAGGDDRLRRAAASTISSPAAPGRCSTSSPRSGPTATCRARRFERWCDCLRHRAERAAMKRLLDDRNAPLAAAIDGAALRAAPACSPPSAACT